MPIFNTPSARLVPAGDDDPLWRFYTLPVGLSVIKVNGHYVSRLNPNEEELYAAGVEGTDYFLGGHRYRITTEVGNALVADGYEIGYAYGEGGYGFGPYGSRPYGGESA